MLEKGVFKVFEAAVQGVIENREHQKNQHMGALERHYEAHDQVERGDHHDEAVNEDFKALLCGRGSEGEDLGQVYEGNQ